MADFSPQTFEAGREYFLTLWMSQYIPGYLGRQDADGTYTFFVDGDPGKQYVRIWQGEHVTLAKCVNYRTALEPNLRVWMRNISGVLTVEYADPVTAAYLYGDNVGAAGYPQAVLPTSNDPIPGDRLIMGRVQPSPNGGLQVNVEALEESGWGGGLLDIASADVPTAANTGRWSIVFFRISVGYPEYVLTAAEFSSALDGTDLQTSSAWNAPIPVDAYRLGAVSLSYGQTAISYSTSRFLDQRRWLELESGADFDLIVTDANYDLIVDANGNVVVSS